MNSYVRKWFESQAQGVFDQREENKVDCNPYEVILRKKLTYEDNKDSND